MPCPQDYIKALMARQTEIVNCNCLFSIALGLEMYEGDVQITLLDSDSLEYDSIIPHTSAKVGILFQFSTLFLNNCGKLRDLKAYLVVMRAESFECGTV